MSAIYVVVIALVAAAVLYIVVCSLSPIRDRPDSASEAMLLEEATIVEPVAPGMEGKAEIRKEGSKPLSLRVRATDSCQAFARGARVRVIDLSEGTCIIEGADEVHLVR